MTWRRVTAGMLAVSLVAAPWSFMLAPAATARPAAIPRDGEARIEISPREDAALRTSQRDDAALVARQRALAIETTYERETAHFLDARATQVAALRGVDASNGEEAKLPRPPKPLVTPADDRPFGSRNRLVMLPWVTAGWAAGFGDRHALTGGAQRPHPGALAAVEYALAQLGDPYFWGANGPDFWDCSALMRAAYRVAGVELPRVSRQQYWVGSLVAVADLLPGDLLFFAFQPDDPASIHHVSLYLGDGLMVHAPRTGDVVRVGAVPMRGYAGAVRVLPAVHAVAPGEAAKARPAANAPRATTTGQATPSAPPPTAPPSIAPPTTAPSAGPPTAEPATAATGTPAPANDVAAPAPAAPVPTTPAVPPQPTPVPTPPASAPVATPEPASSAAAAPAAAATPEPTPPATPTPTPSSPVTPTAGPRPTSSAVFPLELVSGVRVPTLVIVSP